MSYFFPNQPPDVLDFEYRFRGVVAALPQPARLDLYAALSRSLPSLTPTSFSTSGAMVLANQAGREIAFPSPVPMVKLSHIVFGYEEWLERKYRLPGFVEVEPGDVVIDCGAYVGGFSLSASKIASQLHAFEPAEENFACVVRNLGTSSNVQLNCSALYNETRRVQLNLSESSVEHSLLMPDDGRVVAVREIEAISLADYCGSRGLASIDFLKLEAEGVELEIFDGLGPIQPRKLAIDVSPEREGQSPAEEFARRLAAKGYEVRQRAHVMFARK